MGRNRDSYWECRRALRAYRVRRAWSPAPPRLFDKAAVINGERGHVALEPVPAPPKDAPAAAWRVVARWTGTLPVDALITVDGRRLVVVRVRPVNGRRTLAHILCRDEESGNMDFPAG